MELSRGQQEYLLELLSAEYIIPYTYSDQVKEAIQRYSRANYCEEDLDFLFAMPQSLSALLLLRSTDSLQVFAQYFSLWVNCVEYNAFANNDAIEMTFINPDPSARQKLLQLVSINGSYQVIAVPELRYTTSPASIEYACSPDRPISVFSRSTFEGLLRTFLAYAEESDIFPNACQQLNLPDYVQYLATEQQRTACHRFSWSQMRAQAPALATVSNTYQWSQKQEGLILPSNIAFIHYLNAHPIKKTSLSASNQRTPQPASPFRWIDQLMAKLRPSQLMKNTHPPKLPQLPLPHFSAPHRQPMPQTTRRPPSFDDNGHRRIFTPVTIENVATKTTTTENNFSPSTTVTVSTEPTTEVAVSTNATVIEDGTPT